MHEELGIQKFNILVLSDIFVYDVSNRGIMITMNLSNVNNHYHKKNETLIMILI